MAPTTAAGCFPVPLLRREGNALSLSETQAVSRHLCSCTHKISKVKTFDAMVRASLFNFLFLSN